MSTVSSETFPLTIHLIRFWSRKFPFIIYIMMLFLQILICFLIPKCIRSYKTNFDTILSFEHYVHPGSNMMYALVLSLLTMFVWPKPRRGHSLDDSGNTLSALRPHLKRPWGFYNIQHEYASIKHPFSKFIVTFWLMWFTLLGTKLD